MVIDFKDVTFSFREKKKLKTMRRIRLALLLLAVLLGSLTVINYLDLKKVKRVEALLLQKMLPVAEKVLSGIESSFFHKRGS